MSENEIKLKHYQNLRAILSHDAYEGEIIDLLLVYRDIFIELPECPQARYGKQSTMYHVERLRKIRGVNLQDLEPFKWNWPEDTP